MFLVFLASFCSKFHNIFWVFLCVCVVGVSECVCLRVFVLFTYKTYWTDYFSVFFSFQRGSWQHCRAHLSFVLCWHWLVLCSRKYIFSLDLFLLFSCCFLLLTLLFYSLDIRRGENNRFHTHTFIFVIVAYCVLVFVLFRFLCSIGSLSLCCVCVCSLPHSFRV